MNASQEATVRSLLRALLSSVTDPGIAGGNDPSFSSLPFPFFSFFLSLLVPFLRSHFFSLTGASANSVQRAFYKLKKTITV